MRKSLKLVLCLGLILSALCAPAALAQSESIMAETLSIRKGMPMTTFSVHPTGKTDAEETPLYRIDMLEEDGQTLPSLTFPSVGEDAMARMLDFADINFDGYMDILALYAQGASNVTSTFFVYDPVNVCYIQASEPTSSIYYLYPRQRLITNESSDGIITMTKSLYRVLDGELLPTLYREAITSSEESDDHSTYHHVIKQFNADGSETIMLDEYYPVDEADDERSIARFNLQTDLLFEGFDRSQVALANFLFCNTTMDACYHSDDWCAAIDASKRDSYVGVHRYKFNNTPYDNLTPCAQCCASEIY